jgi:PTH1 family peptidyl-tRNA hydrolase
MLIIAGLGNPGAQYQNQRHNIGFLAVDEIHARYRFGNWRQKFSAMVSDGHLDGEKAMLMKPLTYMNLSGQAIGEAARFLKVPLSDILVIHDELDLAPGKVRMKVGGGNGGHNGLKSVDAHLGKDYRRLRLGIGHPGHKDRVSGYVLHDFSKADQEWVGPLISAIGAHAPLLGSGDDTTFGNRVREEIQPPSKQDTERKKSADKPAKTKTADVKPAAPAAEKSTGGPLAASLAKLFGLTDK